MGVAVDQSLRVLRVQHTHDLADVDIHDGGGLVRLGCRAAGACPLRQLAAQLLGQASEEGDGDGVARAAAESLIGKVIGTQRVAVHQQCRHAIQIDAFGVGDERHAGACRIVLCQHEIAVAVLEIHRRARCRQRLQAARRFGGDGFVVVVPRPGFEQVAENVERIGARNVFVEEAKKTPGRGRAFVGEVQVGDEVGAPRLHRPLQAISALVMTTSSSGTSW